MGKPLDVDKMASSFLSELDSLCDSLGLTPEDSATGSAPGNGNPSGRGQPASGDDQPLPNVERERRKERTESCGLPAPSTEPSYRNIDVLLMSNSRSGSGERRGAERAVHSPRSLPDDRPRPARRRLFQIHAPLRLPLLKIWIREKVGKEKSPVDSAASERDETAAMSRAGQSPAASAIAVDSEEFTWEKLDELRSTVVVKRKKSALFFIAPALLAAVAAVAGGIYLLRSGKDAPAPQPAGTIQDGARAGSRLLPNEPGAPAPASRAKKAGSSRSETVSSQVPRGVPAGRKKAAKPETGGESSEASPLLRVREPAEWAGGFSTVPPQSSPQLRNASSDSPAPTEKPEPEAPPAGTIPRQSSAEAAVPAIPAAGFMTQADVTPPRKSPPSTTPRTEPPPPPAPSENPAQKQKKAAEPESPAPAISNPVPAEALVKVAPVYPALARANRITGVVELDAFVNEKGDVVRAEAVAGPMLLRAAAEEALLKWKFKPASVDGVHTPSRVRVSVTFVMK